MGNPIAHSLSPSIHCAFAKQSDIELNYQAILVEVGDFPKALSEFQKQGGKGLNITLPYKEEAFQQVSRKTDKAARVSAVNTIWFDDNGESYGDTTDGVGLLDDLRRNQININKKKVLILGAGGAVRSVLGDLLAQEPEELMIVNRTLARAEELLGVFSDFPSLSAAEYSGLRGQTYDVVINGSSAGLQDEPPDLPDSILRTGAACYDMIYANEDTPFVSWAKKHDARIAIDGLGMLVGQAAESFYIWHGVRPDVAPVIETLRGG